MLNSIFNIHLFFVFYYRWTSEDARVGWKRFGHAQHDYCYIKQFLRNGIRIGNSPSKWRDCGIQQHWGVHQRKSAGYCFHMPQVHYSSDAFFKRRTVWFLKALAWVQTNLYSRLIVLRSRWLSYNRDATVVFSNCGLLWKYIVTRNGNHWYSTLCLSLSLSAHLQPF